MVTLVGTKMTLLQMMQQLVGELGLTASPTQVIGNTDPQIVQLLALSNREGRDTSEFATKNGGWEEMRGEYIFYTAAVNGLFSNTTIGSPVVTGLSTTTGITVGMVCVSSGYIPVNAQVVSVDSSSQVTLNMNALATGVQQSTYFGQDRYDLPSDFGYFMAQTFWDRAFRWQLLGPLEAQEWQVLKSGISPTGPRRRFRVMNNQFYIDPVPAEAGNPEVFEYYIRGWCQSSTATVQTLWAADTDNYILDDDMMILGTKWRFLRAKGLDYAEEYNTWKLIRERKASRNGGERNLPLNSSASGIRLLNEQNVPDTGFGS